MTTSRPVQCVGEKATLNLRSEVEDSIDDELESSGVASESCRARQKRPGHETPWVGTQRLLASLQVDHLQRSFWPTRAAFLGISEK